ncbi:MAG: hypothetical protein K0Q91_1107 [Fibrobacteria bacterium]|jgi:uncharacterized DUF497 family protein|nr:hypothetical protein [Fibrobacteria bacterium]
MEFWSLEWDENKNRINQRKHGISFEEAKTVFQDENARGYYDPDHSEEEDRFMLLGMSSRARMLMICHCMRQAGSVIRIISARKATRGEQKDYGRREG